MHLRQILPSVDDAEWVRVHGALLGGESVYFEAEGRRADGRTVDVSVGLSPHFGALRELAAVSAIIRDISESKALQRLQYEFLAMTSHELRTPLTSIRGHAQLLLRRGVYVQAHLERIVEATDHLGRLVDDLLLASRLESGHFDLQPTSIDLRSVVDAAAHDLMSERNIHIELPDEPLPVWGDPQRLGQVFANLLSNALKYSPPDTDVTVHATRSPMEASVTVIDRGVGIPASALPHLFDRFYRVSGTAHRAQGAGLGLYIANHMVRAHGGHLRVESEVGRGSAFTVSLPILEDAPDLDTSRRSSDGVTTSSV
jgi:signal transduction histidine kinase